MNVIPNRISLLFSGSLLAALLCPLLLCSRVSAADVTVKYVYNLSDFNGIVPYNGARIYPDNQTGEVFVTRGSRVDIFNNRGMEVFDFFLDQGSPVDLAVEPGGDIIALVGTKIGKIAKQTLIRCDYRGEFKREYALSGVPSQYADCWFFSMVYRNQHLYFADREGLKVVETDLDGKFVKGYDLQAGIFAKLMKKEYLDVAFGALDVDSAGIIYFSLPTTGVVGKLAVDGTVTIFGQRGSGPGKFGVPEALSVDRKGFVYVCDKLRSVVLVFDQDLKFVTEFGYRGFYYGNLIVPVSIAVAKDDTVYVGQLLDRGVNVYKLSYD